ncbi:hypothetical protein [Actinoplanes sp. NBRC 103695]|uniref:hypothetical protein n=1 Tax=Actinoplanes sp. NBRC 103695 TaxID=3032202 RepID=UPI0024A36627|nr:hypothetical protein [Actinoplanes sp. NBRC 103695]GLY97877.1 hypothetical protein Acsp02_51310 [Actinoplanes sp. NBRC 103695]
MRPALGVLLALTLIAVPAPASAVPATPVPGSVAVLVVDDFGLGKNPKARSGTRDDNCTVGVNEVGSNGAGDDLPPSGHSHGELVYRVLRDELTTVAGAPPDVDTGTLTEWTYVISGEKYALREVAVHADRYRVDELLAGLRDQIAALRKDGFERIVLNLSFVVVPCDVVGWLGDKSLDELLATYDDMIGGDPTGELKDALKDYLDGSGKLDPALVRAGAFTTTLLRDARLASLRSPLTGAYYRTIDVREFNPEKPPLARLIHDQAWAGFRRDHSSLTIVPVAAAGNGVRDAKGNRIGLPFPFAPALWDFVASAGVDAEPKIAERFNSGEVTLDATGPAALLPDSFGSSFAAPRLSALQAKYLAETGATACGGTPSMGYVDLAGSPPLNLETNSPWKNQGKPSWPGICADFPT